VPNGLLKNLFPGPVTVLFNRSGKLPDEFNPGVPSVSFRLPQVAHLDGLKGKIRRKLQARFVGDLCRFMPFQLIAQTSANLSGSDKNPICIEASHKLVLYGH
jgi:tRNA A37 threonylcarbamoyladenosine synthetase subunit TsaC/SUA5/YrdC